MKARPNAIQRMTSIEVLIQSNQQGRGSYKFPDDNLLRSKTITGIYVVRQSDSQNNVTVSESGYPIIPDTALEKMTINLESDSVEIIQKIPLSFFAGTVEDRSFHEVYLRGFNPTKSTLQTGDTDGFANALTNGQDYAVTILFIYED